MSARRKTFRRDESGAALLEFTVVMMVFFLMLFGTVEFSYLFYQWNAATKAVQHGARLAAVSNPVSSDRSSWDGMTLPNYCNATVPNSTILPGHYIVLSDPRCVFVRECVATNDDASNGSCTNGGVYDLVAMQTIVFGRGKTTCAAPTSDRNVGMCNIFPRIKPQNVKVTYRYTGLGYAGRPGGPVPTITVELRNLSFDYVLLKGFVPGLTTTNLPGFRTTMTGEDLKQSGT